jgi:hypothetical protein
MGKDARVSLIQDKVSQVAAPVVGSVVRAED